MSHNLWRFVRAMQRQRPQSTSYIECVKSVWHVHDETVNIWTHLIATLVFFAVFMGLWDGNRRRRVIQSRALFLYLPAATLFFLCSTIYHVFQNHIDHTIWHTFYHCSITLFVWASSRSFSILAFDRKRAVWRMHGAISTGMALLSILLTLCAEFVWKHPVWALYIIHTLNGSLAAIPAFNRPSGLHWRSTRARKKLLGSFQALILFSVVGSIAYTTRLVDSMLDARTHATSTSHYAMHMAVVIGACVYGQEIILDDYA